MTFSLFGKRTLFTISFLLVRTLIQAQGTPVSQSANSMVNLNTGNFQYSLPVMTVPGPNGENVPITFNYYGGGIRMDEQASWIGLGWSYNPGEISHNVNGVSDDWKNKTIATKTTTSTSQTTENTNFYGPMYFKDVNYTSTTTTMDVANSSYKLAAGLFYFPDYDKLHVSGPGISGTMEARLFDYASLHMRDRTGACYSCYCPNCFERAFSTSKSPNFVFTEELNASVFSPSGVIFPEGWFKQPGYSPNPIGDYSSNAYTASTNRQHTANYIEKFTNGEINTNYTTLKANGFLDYRTITGTRRPTTEFDTDGIGAFRITTPEGMVYHYSLPVYMENEKNASFELTSSLNMDNTKDLKEVTKTDRYALSWKLTAVTAPGYVDVNNNGIADIGDSGYWIAYSYGKWTGNYNWKSPFFNYKHGYDKNPPADYRDPEYTSEVFKDKGNVSSGQQQLYFLNSIQTGTHTAFFIKEVRLDEHSVNISSAITPSLRLSKIVLVRNENIPLFSATGSLPYDNRFSLTNCSSSSIEPHIGNYNANELLIKAGSLSTVELTTDYGLCKMVYNNINNTYNTTSSTYNYTISGVNYSPEIYKASGTSSTTDNANSGKLTLKEIKIYGVGYKATAPSYQFDYDQSNSTKNPNYDTFKADYWGHYKSDHNVNTHGRYTSEGVSGSHNNLDAWSLKKITTPLGGEISVEYESDTYGSVIGHGSPTRTFFATNFNLATKKFTVNNEVNGFINSSEIISRFAWYPWGGYPCFNRSAYSSSDFIYPFTPLTAFTAGTLTSTTQELTPNGSFKNTQSDAGCGTPGWSASMGWPFISFQFSSISGGGIRVKKITIKDTESNQSYINEYSYDPGATGSEPADILVRGGTTGMEPNRAPYDPLVMSPMVFYGKVTVQSKSLNNTYNGKTVYEYNNTYDPMQVTADRGSISGGSAPYYSSSVYSVIETKGILNSPIAITSYDNSNNIINSIKYEYEIYGLPSVSEIFHNTVYFPSPNLFISSLSSRSQKKARLRKKTSYIDGVTTIEEPKAWDLLTGQVTKIRVTDPTTGVTETQTELAYTNTSYATMGAKSKNASHTNQLTVPLKTTVSRDKIVRNLENQLSPGGNMELISGTKTTWRQSIPQRIYNTSTNKYVTQSTSIPDWKPWKTYTYNGDANDANWREEGDITLFNKRNNIIETKTGVSNRYTAAKMGYDQQRTLCQASDSKYPDFTFSGFEDRETGTSWETYFGGEISHGEMRYAGDAAITPHTGNYMAKVDAGLYGPGYFPTGFTPGRSYRASVWIHKNSSADANLVFTLDGSHNGGTTLFIYKNIAKANAANVTVGDWILMTLTIDVPASYQETNGTYGNGISAYLWNNGTTPAYFDDFMVRPVDAALSGNVIDEKTGRTLATLDNYDFATKYVYDDEGRVKETWIETATEGWKLQTRYTYNFKRQYKN